MRLLIAAGGTGGHLFPGIAVARAFKEVNPGGDVLFVGSEKGLEKEILEREGFRRETLGVGRIKGEGWSERVKTFLSLPGSFLRARSILRDFRPDVVLGIGGYSSGPVILTAFWLKIPRAILEPNAIPGFTNRILARLVNAIFVAFPKAEGFFPANKVRLTGTPVRSELTEVGRVFVGAHGHAPVQRDSNKPFTVLVLGGSQGATAINQAVTAALSKLEGSGKTFRLIHQTGSNDEGWVKEAYARTKLAHEVTAFLTDMARVYGETDLVVSRAGASTIAELMATRTPSLLVPYPFAADDHQRVNAEFIAAAGGAEVISNADLGAKIADRILHYESKRGELESMRKKLEQGQRLPATESILRECLKLHVSNT